MYIPGNCWMSQDVTELPCSIGMKDCEGGWDCHHRTEKQCASPEATDVGLCLPCFLAMAVLV